MNKLIIFIIMVFMTTSIFSTDLAPLENTIEKQLKEITEILDQLKIQKKKSLSQINISKTEQKKLDTKLAEIDVKIAQNNARRNNYRDLYGFSQKIQRVYFNKEFHEKTGADYKPVSDLYLNHKNYYKKLFDRFYSRWNIPEENRYKFPEF
ncbi:hypothetical protein KAJ27_11105 [bacterium]|nr:hypothetical protein [bacterium]